LSIVWVLIDKLRKDLRAISNLSGLVINNLKLVKIENLFSNKLKNRIDILSFDGKELKKMLILILDNEF
jgi:hypothetical protein